MEVVRNRETHAGHSAAVKMIMASQITPVIAQGKSGEVGSHARASLYYMVEHWETHLYGGGQESGDSRRS